MNRFMKITQTALCLVALISVTGCTLGQTATPTPEQVDVNAVMTSAASTAFVELTNVAKQASATPAPTATLAPTATETPAQSTASTSTPASALEATSTPETVGLPATETPAVMAGTAVPAVIPSLTPLVKPATGFTGPTCLNAKFVTDVTIPDGTVFKPYEKFHKVWRIQNTGTCTWDQGFGFVFAFGDTDMGGSPQYFSSNDQPVKTGGVLDFGVDLRAPSQPGDYYGHWSMIDDSGHLFGQAVMVYIKVVK